MSVAQCMLACLHTLGPVFSFQGDRDGERKGEGIGEDFARCWLCTECKTIRQQRPIFWKSSELRS